MKVVDLQLYRSRRVIEALEKKIGELAMVPKVGSVRELKTCFKEWLKMNAR
jgi:hypothetical protein